jgi:serine phosphatase RsbU (regulator of sigma subunit)
VPLFYAANYLIATALVFGRDRLMLGRGQSHGALAATRARERVTEELTSDLVLAREIQMSLLPEPTPGWTSVELVCYSQPARDVGGDFYSYYAWSERHVAVAVGDVSGKGVAAALLMAAGLSLVNSSYTRKAQPQRRVARLDRQMMAYTKPREQNCALCYVELDGQLLTVINAGGIAPYIRRASGAVEATDAWGFALGLGLGAQTEYQPVQLHLGRGDLVVIVSDGVLEARNVRGTMFSFGRLEQAIAAGPSSSAAAMRSHLLKRLAKFTGRVEPHDDVTIVVLRG